MPEYRQQFYVDSIAAQTVSLHPEINTESLGEGISALDVNRITIQHAGAVTPPASFWKTAASCGRVEVIIRTL